MRFLIISQREGGERDGNCVCNWVCFRYARRYSYVNICFREVITNGNKTSTT